MQMDSADYSNPSTQREKPQGNLWDHEHGALWVEKLRGLGHWILNEMLGIDVAFNTGNMSQASVLAETLLKSQRLSSPAAQMLVQLRVIRIRIHTQRFQEAHDLLKECQSGISCPALSPLCKEVSVLLRTRLRYNQHNATLTQSQLQEHIDDLAKIQPSIGMLEADRQNLFGLARRRLGETREACLHFHGALLLGLAVSNYALVQAYAYNLSLLAPKPIPLLVYIERLCQQMHLGNDWQWGLISLCTEFWKSEQEGNPITDMDSHFEAFKMPSTMAVTFWEELVKRTKKTNDDRQIGNAYFLAAWGLERIHATTEAKKMKAQFTALCKGNADLARVLKRDFALK